MCKWIGIAGATAQYVRSRDLEIGARQTELQFLSDAGELLGSSLDYHSTLTRLTRLLVPRMADFCVVRLNGCTLDETPIAHVDPTKLELVRTVLKQLEAAKVPTSHDEVVRTGQRPPTGEPLLIWGAYNDDALLVHSLDDLVTALDTLWVYAIDKPRIFRVWSSRDDQLVAAVWRDMCALYIIESLDAFGHLPDEIQLRLIGRAIDWLGNEGPVELGKLEALCEALEDAIHDWQLEPKGARRFRRTLAGAVVTLSRGQLLIEPAPPRRTPRTRS